MENIMILGEGYIQEYSLEGYYKKETPPVLKTEGSFCGEDKDFVEEMQSDDTREPAPHIFDNCNNSNPNPNPNIIILDF